MSLSPEKPKKLTVFEKSQAKQKAFSLPKDDPAFAKISVASDLRRKTSLDLPEVSEMDLTRHFSQLARQNMGIDTHFYPLGSCTMKLNPRVNEWAASLPGFSRAHPLTPEKLVQGTLQVMEELIEELCQITGMTAGTLMPSAGAQGEFVGVQMIAAYHKSRGDDSRTEILVPDNAHGTNPATASMAGLKTVSVKSNAQGDLDLDDLRRLVSDKTAGLMLTNPNTLGLFSPRIQEITAIIHESGGLLFYDGANLNAILCLAQPAAMGFDVMHINLHKTFSTPHGGGGPGAGPVLCNDRLAGFLPSTGSIGRMIGRTSSFYGNVGVCLRAYLYIKLHGKYGLRRVAENAVLNANYLKHKLQELQELFTVPYPQYCMHEFVVQADRYLDKGIRALDIAKRMLDYGVHAPTVYFPLIIKECMLIEPTETESKDTLDAFVEVMKKIILEVESDPEVVRTAPKTLPCTRLDEVRAAKQQVLSAKK